MLAVGSTNAEVWDEDIEADLVDLNGPIFWAPANASTDVVTRMGDEARSVFGPIPRVDCGDGSGTTIPIEVEGNVVDLVRNTGKPGAPLEFRHRNFAGEVVKWTRSLPRCDKPSLGGNVTICGLGSRVSRRISGAVEWLTLCRKSVGPVVNRDPTWQDSNPLFSLLGTIGMNYETGEVVFFDGKRNSIFNWSQPFTPPGGDGYQDGVGRQLAAAIYDSTARIECSACHDNKGPHIVNPHISLSRVGYRDRKRADAFGLGELLPHRNATRKTPYRIVGTNYTSAHHDSISEARTFVDPSGLCTSCHTLTTSRTGRRFAADAVAKPPTASADLPLATLRDLRNEQREFSRIQRFRTRWATGQGGIHPWMTPVFGNQFHWNRGTISDQDWKRISNCIWGAGGSECAYNPAFSRCPKPESEYSEASLVTDPHGPQELSGTLRSTSDDARSVLEVRWRYLNGFGDVPSRDDVRFDLAVTLQQVEEVANYMDVEDKLRSFSISEYSDNSFTLSSEDSLFIRNISYAGHNAFTDPVPTVIQRDYRVRVPVPSGKRYSVLLVPKRFCFDRDGIALGTTIHQVTVEHSTKGAGPSPGSTLRLPDSK